MLRSLFLAFDLSSSDLMWVFDLMSEFILIFSFILMVMIVVVAIAIDDISIGSMLS